MGTVFVSEKLPELTETTKATENLHGEQQK